MESNEIGTPSESMEQQEVTDHTADAENEVPVVESDDISMENMDELIVAVEAQETSGEESQLVDETELERPDRKQIFMENMENESNVSEDVPSTDELGHDID